MNTITLPVAELRPVIAGFAKIMSRRSTLPVLSYLSITRSTSGAVTIAATDLDSWGVYNVQHGGESSNPAAVLIPHPMLRDFVKGMDKHEVVNVEFDDKSAFLVNDLARQKVDFLPTEVFPPLPLMPAKSKPLDMKARDCILRAFECVSTDETRYILSGVYLDVSKKDNHCIVSADGRQLYSANSMSLNLDESVIIPSHKFLEWGEFGKSEWSLAVGEKYNRDEGGKFHITSGPWSFYGRAIAGNYPNWRQVVPTWTWCSQPSPNCRTGKLSITQSVSVPPPARGFPCATRRTKTARTGRKFKSLPQSKGLR